MPLAAWTGSLIWRRPALRFFRRTIASAFVAFLGLAICDAGQLRSGQTAAAAALKPLLSECYARVDFRVKTAVEDGDQEVGHLIFDDLMAYMRDKKWPIATWDYDLDSGLFHDRAGRVNLYYSSRCGERKAFAEEWMSEFCEKHSVCGSYSVELPPLDPLTKFTCQPYWRACDW